MPNSLTYHKSTIFLMLPVIFGAILFLYFLLNMDVSSTKMEEFALGKETVSFFAKVDDFPIHCGDVDNASQCIEGWQNRGKKPVVLWLGNSQLHAVNQMKIGEKTASLLLHNKLKKLGYDVITFSEPNANLQEHLVLFQYLRRKLPVKILILPLVMDDTRETGLRGSIAKALSDPEVRKSIEVTRIGKKLIKNNSNVADTDMKGIVDTVQIRVEKKINDWLVENTDSWKLRPELRGNVFINIYKLRNYMFNITPTSKRAIIKGRYQDNLAALREIFNLAHENNTSVLSYIVPIRNDLEIPYVRDEYKAFKRDIDELARKHKNTHVNLEGLVQSKLWGSKQATSVGAKSEVDFMHFQAGGHHLLAEKLENILLDKYIRETQ